MLYLQYAKNYFKLASSVKNRVAGRAEFLVGVGVAFIGFLVSSLFSSFSASAGIEEGSAGEILFLGVTAISIVIFLFPLLALAMRRIQDFGANRFLALLLIPLHMLLGPIFSLLFLFALLSLPTRENDSIIIDNTPAVSNKIIGFSLKGLLKTLVGSVLVLVLAFFLFGIIASMLAN